MRHAPPILIFYAALGASAAFAADTDDMAAAASGFYAAYGTLHPSDGIPDAATRARMKPYLSPALDRRLAETGAAEERYMTATRHMAPPLLEGDIFTSNFEGATAWSVGPCSAAPGGGRCTIALGYRDPGREDPKPVNWKDTILLVQTPAGWRVDDIAYGGSGAFANKGRLTAVLAEALREAADTGQ